VESASVAASRSRSDFNAAVHDSAGFAATRTIAGAVSICPRATPPAPGKTTVVRPAATNSPDLMPLVVVWRSGGAAFSELAGVRCGSPRESAGPCFCIAGRAGSQDGCIGQARARARLRLVPRAMGSTDPKHASAMGRTEGPLLSTPILTSTSSVCRRVSRRFGNRRDAGRVGLALCFSRKSASGAGAGSGASMS
jgi:hypothetical protein